MESKITFRHMDHRKSVKEYANERSGKVTKYLEEPITVEWILSEEKQGCQVEVLVHGAHGISATSKITTDDWNASIDGAIDKMEKQLRRLKDKIKDKHRGRA